MDLEDYREEIDRINQEIAEDISERMEIVQEIGEYKKENDIPIKDENREKKVKDQFAEVFSEENLPEERGREVAEMLIQMAIKEELKDD